MRTTLDTPADFELGSAVCSHGFFVLSPNRWDSAGRALTTVITLDDCTAVRVTVRAVGQTALRIASPASLPANQRAAVRRAVIRMLRLDEDLGSFHALCERHPSHQAAARMRFGRLLRSATLFEDCVKVICTCNVSWRQTVGMIERIVATWGVPTPDGLPRGFPTPGRLAAVPSDELKRVARVGYRADFIHRLATELATGGLNLAAFESFAGSSDELHHRLCRIRGIGPYAAANLAMLLGRYDRLAVDTELVRFFRERHPRLNPTPARIQAYYRRWHPYEFLAYWYELWQGYVARHGPADTWSPDLIGRAITTPATPAQENR